MMKSQGYFTNINKRPSKTFVPLEWGLFKFQAWISKSLGCLFLKAFSSFPLLFLAVVFWEGSFVSLCQAGIFNPKTYLAKNGLRVVVLENHRAPVVTQSLWYQWGAADDPSGQSGLAHYLEHMMFKGKPGSPNERISREVTHLGGQLNAGTSSDLTFYYETVSSQHLETIMRLGSGRMKALQILPDQAKTEKEVILEERRFRVENDPEGKLREIMGATYFVRHPYGSPQIGWEQDIRDLTPGNLKAFHATGYQPSNAILIIAGDVTLQQVKKLVTKYYEPIPSRSAPKRSWLQDPPRALLKPRFEYASSHVEVPYFYRYYEAPHPKTHKLSEVYALEVLVTYLTEAGTGYLYRRLVEERRIASMVGISFSSFSRDPTPLVLVSQPAPGHTIQELEQAIDDELKALVSHISHSISESEILKVKERKIALVIYAKDTAFAGAYHFGFGLCTGKTFKELDHWDTFIQRVTVKEVREIAQKVFGASSHLTAYLIPKNPLKKP